MVVWPSLRSAKKHIILEAEMRFHFDVKCGEPSDMG